MTASFWKIRFPIINYYFYSLEIFLVSHLIWCWFYLQEWFHSFVYHYLWEVVRHLFISVKNLPFILSQKLHSFQNFQTGQPFGFLLEPSVRAKNLISLQDQTRFLSEPITWNWSKAKPDYNLSKSPVFERGQTRFVADIKWELSPVEGTIFIPVFIVHILSGQN